MKVLVTGGTGFIGSHLVDLLVRGGDTVCVLCRNVPDQDTEKSQHIEFAKGDICDASSVKRAMQGCEAVFHLAAYARSWAKDDHVFETVNVEATDSLLRCAGEAGARKIVFTSSNLTLGPSQGRSIDEDAIRETPFFTLYERSKALAEERVQEYVGHGLDVVTVNPTRVFGPGPLNEANSVTKMIGLYLDDKWRFVLGNGKNIGNYVYVEDVAKGHVLALKYGVSGQRYILGGQNLSFDDFFRILSDITGKAKTMVHVPVAAALGFARLESVWTRLSNRAPLLTQEWVRLFAADWACTSEKAREDLGYEAMSFRDAAEKTIGWLRERENEDQ